MKVLTMQEIHNVSGGDFTQDITTLSATVFVATQIGIASRIITDTILTIFLGASGLTALVLPHIAAITVPMVMAEVILQNNPQMQDFLVDKFHSYFG